jgi:hypothetical protein
MAAVTCVERDDVAEHLLSRPGTEAIRCGQIVTWPTGWSDKGNASRAAWDVWNSERIEGLGDHDGGKRARVYYRAHRKALTAGMSVSWRHRYHVGDAERPADPDALYAAMWDFYDLGEPAFMAERQNAPIKRGVTLYNLTAAAIESRATDRAPGEVPTWVRMRVAATDVNPSYGLTWVIAGFGTDQTAAVIGYGVHPMSVGAGATQTESAQALFEELVKHGKMLAALPCRPESWMIDASGAAFDVVLRFCANSVQACGVQAIAATGRGARNYKPYGKSIVGKPREQCHMASDMRGRKWIAWHADYWREAAQKSWTGSVGAPGSCALPAGNHREFAEQICREQLAGKGEIGGAMQWVWHTQPGPHDFGDCMAMAFMAAAWQGIGTGGQVVRNAQHRRRSTGVTVIPM